MAEGAEEAGFGSTLPASRAARLGGWVYAHRGLHGSGVPENSLAAIAAAVERGLGIECDVQRSSDGYAMVFHDWDLDRLTAEHGPVADRNAAELGRIALAGNG
ncbi:MAG: glycerophosphodiester phosphodiesterase family protein, partial [Novosphingobium sp.]